MLRNQIIIVRRLTRAYCPNIDYQPRTCVDQTILMRSPSELGNVDDVDNVAMMSNSGRYAPQWHVNIIHVVIIRRRTKLYLGVPRTWCVHNVVAFLACHILVVTGPFAYKKRIKKKIFPPPCVSLPVCQSASEVSVILQYLYRM